MPDETLTAILRRIIVEPDEDHHRLVYADRLDELGQPEQAYFIRESITHAAQNYDWATNPTTYSVGFRPLPPEMDGRLTTFRRGFLESWITDAETFLKHADQLIWHPDQTVPCTGCGKCKPAGHIYTGKDGMKWIRCLQPRRCPETAQPVRTVTLTTGLPYFYQRPDGTWVDPHRDDPARFPAPTYFNRGSVVEGRELEYLKQRWPGVTFVLLPLGTEEWADDEVWGTD